MTPPEKTDQPSEGSVSERFSQFTTVSGHPIRRLYTPDDVAGAGRAHDLGDDSVPGEPPYTRGIHPAMYRSRLWTMRQFAGFGTAEDTNARFRYLLGQGQNGLSVAFDLPTLMGYDSDHALARGEVGKCGVAISSLADMETLFRDIPLESVTTSMTINSPAAVIWYVSGRRGKAGGGLEDSFRNAAERHSERIHRAEGIHLPSRAFVAPGDRHD